MHRASRPSIENRFCFFVVVVDYGQVLQEAFAREIVNVVNAVNAAAKAKVRACMVAAPL